MKTIKSIGLIFLILATSIIGCKKGENDPGLSLLSRKARLSGEWNLSSAEFEFKKTDPDGTTVTSYSYDGANMTETTDGEGKTYVYSEKVTIDKDGTFTIVIEKEITYSQNQTGINKTTLEGYWYFIDGIKNTDIKNKERVEFFIQKYTNIHPSGDTEIIESSGSIPIIEERGFSGIEILLLDRLAKKEMTTLYDSEVIIDGETRTYTGIKDYTQN
ncbi:MAG: RHS repeat protein [Bacteroidales bacterium]|nr:RHS repeat protein [Bacteroidales bacterium]